MGSGGPLQTDFFRFRRGDAKPVISPTVNTADVIRIGHLVRCDAADSRKTKSFTSIEDIGGAGPATLAAAQELAHDEFLGVAAQRSLSGETQGIRTNTRGVHEFKAVSAVYRQGDLVGGSPDGAIPGAALLGDTVESVPTANRAVGRVADDSDQARTSVLVEIMGTITENGAQTPA